MTGSNSSSVNSSTRSFSSGSASSTSQLTPSPRQQQSSYRQTDANRNTGVHFNSNRNHPMRGSGQRSNSASGSSYSSGKSITRSLSGGALDYQRSGTSSHYRGDSRAGHSPNYNRGNTSGYQNSPVTSSGHSSGHGLSNNSSSGHSSGHGLANNSSSQHSIHSLPGINLGTSSGNFHNSSSVPTPRSAPASVDSSLNDFRSQPNSYQGKPGVNIWHSGPPFYGPPSSSDPPNLSKNGRSVSTPKTSGNFSSSNSQMGYSGPGVRQGSSHGPYNNDEHLHNEQRIHDRHRKPNPNNAASNGIPSSQNRMQSKVPRQGKNFNPC